MRPVVNFAMPVFGNAPNMKKHLSPPLSDWQQEFPSPSFSNLQVGMEFGSMLRLDITIHCIAPYSIAEVHNVSLHRRRTSTLTLSVSSQISSLKIKLNVITPELNPSVQRCMTRFFTVGFAS
jgi:hypothetical protein